MNRHRENVLPERRAARKKERKLTRREVDLAFGNRIKFNIALRGKAKQTKLGGDPGHPTRKTETRAHRKVRRRMRKEALRAQR